MAGTRRKPAHAGSAADQERIARRLMGRAEARQRDPRLDAVDRDILNVIDRRTFLGYGDGRVGVKVLAEQVHRCTRTVRRHVARLECLGYVEVSERQHGHGGPAVNLYRVANPKDRGPGAFVRRRRARRERDAARKRRRSGRGVLTRMPPTLTRGRVNARTGTGEYQRCRPAVPAGGEKRIGEVVTMGARALGAAEAQTRREVEARWERMAAAAERVEAVGGGEEPRGMHVNTAGMVEGDTAPMRPEGWKPAARVERDAAERDAGRDRVAELVARAQAAQARRLGVGPGAPWERGE